MGIEEVVNNVINIDKNANELRQNLQKQLKEKEVQLKKDISKLKQEIDDNQMNKLKELEKTVLEEANEESENLINQTKLSCNDMHEKFVKNKDTFCREMFNQIFVDNSLRN